MSYRPSEDAEDLRLVVRDFLTKHADEREVRVSMETASGFDRDLWRRFASELDILGVALPEAWGGGGASLVELGVVFEEFGRALTCAPLLSTVGLAANAILACGDAGAQSELLPSIAEGTVVATVAWSGPDIATSDLAAARENDGWTVSGTAVWVADGAAADVILVAAQAEEGPSLFVTRGEVGVSREPLTTLDQTRRLARIEFDRAPVRPIGVVGAAGPGLERTRDIVALLLAAEQLGGAARALESAVSYATTRVQFGRTIGSFQAIKHRCADLLILVETCRSVVEHGLWAAVADPGELQVSASLAGAIVGEAFTYVAEQNIQIHGGIGFTWEHDAHLLLKRAKSSELLFGVGRVHRARLAKQIREGRIAPEVGGRVSEDPGAAVGDATGVVSDISGIVADFLARHPVNDTADRSLRAARFDEGLAMVSFERSFGGRGLPVDTQGYVEQLFAEAGCADWLGRNVIGLGMVLPTLNAHGTPDQRARYLKPCFTGEEIWCQLFSEPDAGSDLAGLATRAALDGDDFVVNGQKVWTSLGHVADYAILLARTDPDVPKHQGLTFFIVDMRSPGVEVRPLRQLTGEAEFNEVYLSDVRVPRANVVGKVGGGWTVAMTTLSNERVSLGRRVDKRGEGPIARAIEAYLDAVAAGAADAVVDDRLSGLWARAEAARLTNVRASSSSSAPGPEGSIAKLQMAELNQAIYSFCLDVAGASGLLIDGYDDAAPAETSVHGAADLRKAYLRARANSIEGGTSEILRTVLGERVLGLEKEPAPDRHEPWRRASR